MKTFFSHKHCAQVLLKKLGSWLEIEYFVVLEWKKKKKYTWKQFIIRNFILTNFHRFRLFSWKLSSDKIKIEIKIKWRTKKVTWSHNFLRQSYLAPNSPLFLLEYPICEENSEKIQNYNFVQPNMALQLWRPQ